MFVLPGSGGIGIIAARTSDLMDIFHKVITLVQTTRTAAEQFGLVVQEAVIGISLEPSEVHWNLVMRDPIPQNQKDAIDAAIMAVLPSWTSDDVEHLMVLSSIVHHQAKICDVLVRFECEQRDVVGLSLSLPRDVPEEHVDAFMDLARRQDEAGFKDLARMTLPNLKPNEIAEMWDGAVKRLARQPV